MRLRWQHRLAAYARSVRPCSVLNLSSRVCATVLIAGFLCPVAAQTISGRLLDDSTDAPIESGVVSLLDLEGNVLAETGTESGGGFQLQVPEPALYQLRARRIGYQMATSPPLDMIEFSSMEVEFRLSSMTVSLAPITVVAREYAGNPSLVIRGFYTRKDTYGREGMGFGHFLEAEDIARRNPLRVSDIVRDIPGIYVQPAGGWRWKITGRNGCAPTFVLDGSVVRGSIDDLISASSVVAVEVYPGVVAPGEFLTAAAKSCATVVVWTGVR